MFGILPYRVDVPEDRWPVVNWLLIAVNVAVFISTFHALSAEEFRYEAMVADGWKFSGLFGHMFLHASVGHIFGNMLFLWVFGNAVCAKLSNWVYLPVYFIVGLASVTLFNILSDGRMIGASGAINGIVAMYLVFFPLNDVDCLFFLGFRIHPFTLSGYWLILMWLVFDILGLVFFSVAGSVAYAAHIGGFIGGFGIAVLLLKYKLVSMERYEYSLLDVIKHKGRPKKNTMVPEEYQALYNRRVGILDKTGEDQVSGEAGYGYAGGEESKPKVKAKSLKEKRSEAAFSVKAGHIIFYCDCGKKVRVPVSFSGKQGRCPECDEILDIPKVRVS